MASRSDSIFGKAGLEAARALPPHLCRPIDEGYSEDSRSQTGMEDDSAVAVDDESAQIDSIRQWLLSQPPLLRASFARELVHSLPTYLISDLSKEIDQRLHFDPVLCLPEEIISYVMHYCDPATLQAACLVSRAWRVRASNVRLWKRLYQLEGWQYSAGLILDMEKAGENKLLQQQQQQDRRASLRSASWRRQSETLEGDEDMVDVSEADTADKKPISADIITWDPMSASTKANWRYLFHQRKRLEYNWIHGRYKNFRLPHINHQDEAHKQCVYTIQYTAKHLVSGSRDKSVRVWDLDTQRLKYGPLVGHKGSVLCLQYDERPQSDIIVSGGSDSDVVIWRFSTGTMIKRLSGAHRESVLNLRFDDRYLVTCSKDKTIKVWSRWELLPSHPDYPRKQRNTRNAAYPAYIVSIDESPRSSISTPVAPYELLMTFEGHGAAVNAIQILGDEIVSASGDRKIVLWNIKTGRMIRQYVGHAKGIACVQYDGRRIVSGSSDNTVRIFDSSTAAEVAVLEGHRNLVRTVQADFGDVPGDAEELEAQARADDHRILEARKQALQYPDRQSWAQPYFVQGAKLPSGGGGNKWSKIVSGSYDETVIIWRRQKSGRWSIANELRQEDALRAASGHPSPGSSRRSARPMPPYPGYPAPPAPSSSVTTTTARSSPGASNGDTEMTQSQTPTPPPAPTPDATQTSNSLAPQIEPPPVIDHQTQTPTTQPRIAAHGIPAAAPAYGQQNQLFVQNAHAHAPGNFNQSGPSSRVFKLQFDARRIICCSQEPVIVGWDFANGDEELIEASKYFGEPN